MASFHFLYASFNKRNQKGFTLVEILIAIALMATLAIIALISLNPQEQIKKTSDRVLAENSNTIYSALQNVYTAQGKYPWSSDVTGVALDSTQGMTIVNSLISNGELKPTIAKLIGNNLSKIFLTATTDGHTISLCFIPNSTAVKADSNTTYDMYGNIDSNCSNTACYVCIGGNNNIAQSSGASSQNGTGASPSPNQTPSTTPPPSTVTQIPTPTITPTPSPTPKVFTNLSGSMEYSGNAIFSFSYPITSSYVIDVSTIADMSWDVYLSFAQGANSPVTETNPRKWDKYSCGRSLYWRVKSADGIQSSIQTTVVNCGSPTPTSIPIPTTTGSGTRTIGQTGAIFNKNVFLIVYNPQLSSTYGNKKVTTYFGWNDPYTLTNSAINWFKTTTNNRVNYTIVQQVELNKFPTKGDGFTYNETSYYNVVKGLAAGHSPDIADYNAIVNETNACTLFNSGQIDEVWMFGGPWFGFYESRLAGINAYWDNSPALTGTSCINIMPIMGYSYERGMSEMIHDFGHRTEGIMAKVYGSWSENRLNNNFDRFALDKTQSPNYNFSGCGNTHYPPNATSDYDYANLTPVNTMCDDFIYYPNVLDINSVPKLSIDCRTWGCTDIGYYQYWFNHLPKFIGAGSDGKLNDWWDYLLNPNKAL